jgi:hypothetical protein
MPLWHDLLTPVTEPKDDFIMKKVYAAVAAAMMLAGTASAQFKLGVEGGINLNNLANHYQGETVSNQIKVGIHAGIVTDLSISNNFSVAPGLRYIMKGAVEESNYNGEVDGFSASIEEKNKLTYHYIELPVNLVYKTGTEGSGRFLIGAGPYLAYMVNAQNSYKVTAKYFDGGGEPQEMEDKGSTSLEIGDDEGDQVKATDFGVQGFLGYQMASGMFAKVGSSVGLSNTFPGGGSEFKSKNYNFFLTVGYMFGGR